MTASKRPSPSRDDLRRELLATTLRHVPFDGWTMTALIAGGRDLDFDLAEVRRLFPGGTEEVVDLFVADADRLMVEELDKLDLPAMRIRDRIKTAVQVRLEQQAPYKEAIRRALALQVMPQKRFGAMRGLYRTVDLMWRAADDNATDINFYSKRLLLAGVYTSTVLYKIKIHLAMCEVCLYYREQLMTIRNLSKILSREDVPVKREEKLNPKAKEKLKRMIEASK